MFENDRWNSGKKNDSYNLTKGKLPLNPHPTFSLPDQFLMRYDIFEVRGVPATLTNGSVWDQLSISMWKKFLMHRQGVDEYRKKINLWKLLCIHMKNRNPNYGLLMVGSTLTGFGGTGSDVDMCLIVQHCEINRRSDAYTYLGCIRNNLLELDFIADPELIFAKVPILKFKDIRTGLHVDLNCNNFVGIRNTHLLYCYSQLDWRVRPLVIVIKLWAHFHNINDAKNMTISSYSLTLMVLHFLQCGVKPEVLPCLHKLFPNKFSNVIEISEINIHEKLKPYVSLNCMSIGELLISFFKYYSHFNYSKHAVSVRRGTIIPIDICRQVKTIKNDPHQWKLLCIEEPFDLTNTARSVYNRAEFSRILRIFRLTAQTLGDRGNLDSIFKPM